ncbi:hypothetical protein VSH64_32740 [Amycolatopsis rhabdoformis]|uniref:Uncharacterized protein n=1 Tax=Amycolatopsis rhabdoformis TaxID=1448059 RepID=A0ABZ1I1R9_9PSEU|nr:hypothetical protein [Amycolatopsis rhabdoformis]WSE27595.1 hypothetical protein VSH64_32740 [Amycolatopsis rhabdoformis]
MTDEAARALWAQMPLDLQFEVDRLVTDHQPAAALKVIRKWGLDPKPGIAESRAVTDYRTSVLKVPPRFT